MKLGKLLRKRRNVYGFLTKPIPQQVLRSMIEDATHVPSAGFTQDFEFVIIDKASTKRKVAEAAYESEYVKTGHAEPGFISKAPVLIIPCGSKPRFESKYGKPAEENSRLPWWVIDAGFASLALILSAYERGLAASFIGALDDEKIAEVLGLPSDQSIVPLAVIPLGYPNPRELTREAGRRAEIRKRRRQIEEILHWNAW